MLETMQSMLDTFRQPQTLHAALVHLPIAVSIVGLLLVLMLMLGGGKSHGMRWAVFVLYLVGATTAFFAHTSGEAAEHALTLQMADGVVMTPTAKTTLETHEFMGEFVWMPLAVVSLASLLSVFKSSGVRVTMLVIAVIGSLFSAGWVAATAHYGGQLVYVHGVGVPTSPNNVVKPLPTAEPVEGTQPAEPSETAPPTSEKPPVPAPVPVDPPAETNSVKPAPQATPPTPPAVEPGKPDAEEPKETDKPAPVVPPIDKPTADDVI